MIFATNLAPMLNIVGLREYGIEIDIEEDGKTLEENAIKKALTIYNQTKQSVVADDSGLFIDYFEGWPGVYHIDLYQILQQANVTKLYWKKWPI